MTRLNYLIAAIVVFALSGCATPQNYEAKMKSFIGLNHIQLVEEMKSHRFGDPISAFRVGEDTKIAFLRNRWIAVDKLFDITDMNCHTTFTLHHGLVSSYEYHGDKCVAF